MLYSQTIKNLVSGISQQSPIQRYAEQLETQVNGLSTEANGLQKRPPTIFVKKLGSALGADVKPLVHFINRDENEKYFVYFYNGEIKVYDIKGNEHSVSYENDKDYLAVSNPRDELAVITVADYTFITNKNKVVKMRSDRSVNVFATQGTLISVKSGQYGRNYAIYDSNNNLLGSYTTLNGENASDVQSITTTTIAANLASSISEKNKYTVIRPISASWLCIQGGTNFRAEDGYNNQAMLAFENTAQRFNLLPSSAPNNYTVKIIGDPNGGTEGSYYVRYNANEKIWEECVAPNILLGFDKATMPHALVRNSDGTFTFKRFDWADREIGDEDSNPLPSFVNGTITDIFFYRNRLGFLSGENVVLSESAEYANFWMTTASDILDTDCIDVPVTTSRINNLNYAVPFDGELYCFSDSSQFVLRADTTLSPKNTALVEVTGFASAPDCRPVRAGRNLYFASKRAEYTSIKEYYSVQQTSDEKNAQDITSHVPDYIPNSVYHIEAGDNENVLLVLTTGATNKLYVYKYLFLNENRVQASWSEWDMGGHIYGAFFVGSTLYFVLNRGCNHVLEQMNFTTSTTEDFPDNEQYRVYLDCKKLASAGSYDDIEEKTSFDIFNEYDMTSFCDIKKVGIVLNDNTYKESDVSTITDGKLYVDGNYSGTTAIVGFPYEFTAKLSPIYIRQTDSNGSSRAYTNGRLQVRCLEISYANTGGFIVEVKKTTGDNKYEYKMTGRQLGTQSSQLGKVPMKTGIFKVPIQCLNTNADIQIKSDMSYPLALINLLWAGTWVQKSRGV